MLVITIIILLILAGITLATLTGENGLFKRAIEAREKTRYGIAEEKVKLAVNASYGGNGYLEKKDLKENINKIEGLHEKITGEISYDLTIKVDGYEFKITELGQVTYVGRTEEKPTEPSKPTKPEKPQPTEPQPNTPETEAGKEMALEEGWTR